MTSRPVRLLAYSLCAGLLAGTAPAADPEWLGLAPRNTFVFGVDIERLDAAKAEQFLVAFLYGARGVLASASAAEKGILRGSRELLIAFPTDARDGRYLLMLSGSFSLADVQAVAGRYGMSMVEIRNAKVFLAPRGRPFMFALLDGTRIVGGDRPTVQNAIARQVPAGGLGSLAVAKIRALRSTYDFWVFTNSFPEMVRGAEESIFSGALTPALIDSIRQISGGLIIAPAGKLSLDVVTRTEPDAIGLAKVLHTDLLELAAAHAKAYPLVAALRGVELKAEGYTVKIELACCTEADLMKWMTSAPPSADVVIQTPPADSGAAPSSGETGVVTLPGP
jgi:hypothetical protein